MYINTRRWDIERLMCRCSLYTKKRKGERPKILIHACCGACSVYPLIYLACLFDITVLYTNSNIYPKEEYDKRYEALKKHIDFLNKTFNIEIKLILDNYEYDEFRNYLLPYADLEEGQIRCTICIYKRLARAFRYAKDLGFPFVSTIMNISRNKKIDDILKAGEHLEKEYKGEVNFAYFEFRKNNGQDIGVELSKEEDIYRQDYCGCEFSRRNK